MKLGHVECASSDVETDDLSIESYSELISPAHLRRSVPITPAGARCVVDARDDSAKIIAREDDRLLVVVGPCSIHDPDAALEYANLLLPLRRELQCDLHIVMRAYFEKPRTSIGWKGLINDPDLNGTFQINKGLMIARRLLSTLNDLGMPVGCELLDTISPQFIADLVSWGAIGARTTECQLHRELASGTSFPIGFKNGTTGDVQIAIDAIEAASHPHVFLGVNKSGMASICRTRGNRSVHMILRGGKARTNYDKGSVEATLKSMESAALHDPVLMIDCSHGNSEKLYTNQARVCSDIARQVGEGNQRIVGVMIESFLVEGKQSLPRSSKDLSNLVYGKSITDGCIAWDETVVLLRELAQSVRARRSSMNLPGRQ